MTLHHEHVCRVHLVFFNSSRDGIKPWLDDSPEPKWHLNNSVEHIRSYSYFALHLEATLPVTHTQTDRLGLTWIPKKQGDTRSECVWASSPFLLPLVFLANENLKITCSPLKIWVRAPMRSQFNTKASSSALWVFPPVVELRQGAWVCVLLDAYSCSFFFFFLSLQMDCGAVEQQFLIPQCEHAHTFCSLSWCQILVLMSFMTPLDDSTVYFNCSAPPGLLVARGTRGQCCIQFALVMFYCLCRQPSMHSLPSCSWLDPVWRVNNKKAPTFVVFKCAYWEKVVDRERR